jgi:hypothetical protein
MQVDYKQKYLKYKGKYEQLKHLKGGGGMKDKIIDIIIKDIDNIDHTNDDYLKYINEYNNKIINKLNYIETEYNILCKEYDDILIKFNKENPHDDYIYYIKQKLEDIINDDYQQNKDKENNFYFIYIRSENIIDKNSINGINVINNIIQNYKQYGSALVNYYKINYITILYYICCTLLGFNSSASIFIIDNKVPKGIVNRKKIYTILNYKIHDKLLREKGNVYFTLTNNNSFQILFNLLKIELQSYSNNTELLYPYPDNTENFSISYNS